MTIETVICPKCKKPFPKLRRDLGYQYCVNCSPQGTVHPVIESIGQGEEAETIMHIVTQQEFNTIQRGQRMLHANLYENPDIEEEEEAPDMSTFEEQEEAMSHLSPLEKEAQIQALENEQNGMSERSLEEFEDLMPLMDEDEEEE